MKSFNQNSALFSIIAACLLSSTSVFAQEYDDMYFRKSDRKANKRAELKATDPAVEQNQDIQADGNARNMNPDYMARYELLDSDTTQGYFDEDYNDFDNQQPLNNNGQQAGTVVNNYYGNDFRNWDDIYWSNPIVYRNTIYDPFWRMRVRTWGPRYGYYYDAWDPFYRYGRNRVVVRSGWGWNSYTVVQSWGWGASYYDPWAYNTGFYDWNNWVGCGYYPSYSYYGINRHMGGWYQTTSVGYVNYADNRNVNRAGTVRGRRPSVGSMSTGRVASTNINNSGTVVGSRGNAGGRTAVTTLNSGTTSRRVLSNSIADGRTPTRGGRTENYDATSTNATGNRSVATRGELSSNRGYETRNLNTYRSRGQEYYNQRSGADRSSRQVVNRTNSSNRTTNNQYGNYRSSSQNEYRNSTTRPNSGYSRSSSTTRSRQNSYSRSATRPSSYTTPSRSSYGTTRSSAVRSYGNSSSNTRSNSRSGSSYSRPTNSSRSSGSSNYGRSSSGSSSRSGNVSRGSSSGSRSSGSSRSSSGGSRGNSGGSRGNSGGRGN